MSEDYEHVPELEEALGTQVVKVEEISYEKVVFVVEAEINEQGWDQYPLVAFLIGDENAAQVVAFPMPKPVLEYFADAFPMLVQHMADFLRSYNPRGDEPLPPMMQTIIDDVLGYGFVGILFSLEGWTVPEPDKDTEPEKHEEWQKARRENTFHEHDDRIETRQTFIVTPISDFYWLGRLRGEKPSYQFISGDNWEPFSRGMVVETARNFMRVILTLQMLKGLVSDEVLDYWHRDLQRTKDHPLAGMSREEVAAKVNELLRSLAERHRQEEGK